MMFIFMLNRTIVTRLTIDNKPTKHCFIMGHNLTIYVQYNIGTANKIETVI